MSASSNGAAINVNSKTNSQNNMDTIEFSTKSTYILLTSARVTSLVRIASSKVLSGLLTTSSSTFSTTYLEATLGLQVQL